MKKFSAKNKIVILVIAWAVASAAMLMYGFGILQDSNQKIIFSIQESKKELAGLESERNSYNQAQKDLEQIKQEALQPEEFFSQDTTFSNELEFLEGLQDKLGIKLTVMGISGTTKTSAKAKTQSDIVYVPYSIAASGPFENILRLSQVLENSPFVTSINSIGLSVADKDNVNYSMTGNFYIRR